MITDHRILRERSFDSLNLAIVALINQGWQPSGEIFASGSGSNPREVWAQAMVKHGAQVCHECDQREAEEQRKAWKESEARNEPERANPQPEPPPLRPNLALEEYAMFTARCPHCQTVYIEEIDANPFVGCDLCQQPIECNCQSNAPKTPNSRRPLPSLCQSPRQGSASVLPAMNTNHTIGRKIPSETREAGTANQSLANAAKIPQPERKVMEPGPHRLGEAHVRHERLFAVRGNTGQPGRLIRRREGFCLSYQ